MKEISLNTRKNIKLADKKYNIPKIVDVLLGAKIFYEILGTRKLSLGESMPVLQETNFGWILTGEITTNTNFQEKNICNYNMNVLNEILNQNITKFWQVEELPQKQILSREAQKCEDYFSETTTHNSEGRFVVRLPFRDGSKILGIEFGLQQNDSLKNTQFMKEYKGLNHMSFKCNLSQDKTSNINSYFLPHDAVVKQ